MNNAKYKGFLLRCVFIAVLILPTSWLFSQTTKQAKPHVYITVQSILQDANCNKHAAQNVKCMLKYNTEDAYYSYTLNKTWVANGSYQLTVNSTLSTGFLYFFNVDAQNNVGVLKIIKLDTLKKLLMPLSACAGYDVLKFIGTEYLSVWYIKNELKNYEMVINGIELTYGDYIARNKLQSGASFMPVNTNWNFSKEKIGFTINPSFLKENDNLTIPLMIEFNIKNKI